MSLDLKVAGEGRIILSQSDELHWGNVGVQLTYHPNCSCRYQTWILPYCVARSTRHCLLTNISRFSVFVLLSPALTPCRKTSGWNNKQSLPNLMRSNPVLQDTSDFPPFGQVSPTSGLALKLSYPPSPQPRLHTPDLIRGQPRAAPNPYSAPTTNLKQFQFPEGDLHTGLAEGRAPTCVSTAFAPTGARHWAASCVVPVLVLWYVR